MVAAGRHWRMHDGAVHRIINGVVLVDWRMLRSWREAIFRIYCFRWHPACLSRRIEDERRRLRHTQARSLIWYMCSGNEGRTFRTISGSGMLIKGNRARVLLAFDLAPLLRVSRRRVSLGRAFLAGALPCAGTLIGAAPLRFGVVLAVVAATNAIIALRASRIATYLARATLSARNYDVGRFSTGS